MKTDVLIIGSGLAGIICALELSEDPIKIIITTSSSDIFESNSYLAQGGMATVAYNDSEDVFAEDIMKAGCFQSDKEAVSQLVTLGPKYIEDILIDKYKVDFDKKNSHYDYSKEAFHSKNRILHFKDSTGKHLIDILLSSLKKKKNITFLKSHLAVDLIKDKNKCLGACFFEDNKEKMIFSKKTVLATGGAGNLFSNSTNCDQANGSGLYLADKIGAELMDLEYIQFHPTKLYSKNRSFLISETLRGEGANLLNIEKKPFMKNYHEEEELAPRDIVTRAIFSEMKKHNSDHVFLDLSFKDSKWIINRFPTIYKTCLEDKIDITKDLIPITPAAHYLCGGVSVDLDAKTSVENLYAVGETARTGLHGANRLASTSLLECVVWAKKASLDIEKNISEIPIYSYTKDIKKSSLKVDESYINKAWDTIRKTMWEQVGIVRTHEGLKKALSTISELKTDLEKIRSTGINKDILVLSEAIDASILIIRAAMKNNRSIGTHFLIK